MNVIGVDLAWGERKGTGLCAVSNGTVVASCRRSSLDDIVDWIRPYTVGNCIVAIDAPLIITNETGRRPCESTISRCFGGRHASTHSSNLRIPAFKTGGRAAELARRLRLDTDPSGVPKGSGRWAIEVYPHAALVGLFDLPFTLKYKAKHGRTVDGRRAAFAACIAHLESLSDGDPPIDLAASSSWLALKEEIANATTASGLDEAEDELDAYICAYVGLLLWTHGLARSRVVGDIETGYIVTPVTDELAAKIDMIQRPDGVPGAQGGHPDVGTAPPAPVGGRNVTADSVVLFDQQDKPHVLVAERYEVERALEDRLVSSRELLAGAQMTPEEPRQWLLVRQQFPLRSRGGTEWSADILFVDQDGVPTIVEVKRADNRELRRMIVGQVLDYAAALRYGSVERIRQEFEQRANTDDIREAEYDRVLNGSDPDQFWAAVADNVSDGRIRLVIAADEIPAEVQAVVEYLNEQLRSAELFALGVLQYRSEGRRVLVSRLAGATAAARTTKKAASPIGPGYEVALAQATDEARQAASLLDDWARRLGVEHADSPSARKWMASEGRTICRFYPGQPTTLQIDLTHLWDGGRAAEAEQFFAEIAALNPTHRLNGNRLPSVTGADVVACWDSLQNLLGRFLQAVESPDP